MKKLLVLLLLLPLVGCEDPEDAGLTVYAAASLQEAFTELAEDFEEEHGVDVTFNFGPSSGLAEQINAGADADVFASASVKTMEQVETDAEPEVFAVNTMQIAVPADNPAGITGLADLVKPDVKVALCQAQVPCGTVAATVVENAGLGLTPVSEETDVKAVLTKVQLGEVDAGIVYVTDVRSAGDKVAGVEIPGEVNASTAYPIVALDGDELAREWVELVLSDEGRQVLDEYGFSAPE